MKVNVLYLLLLCGLSVLSNQALAQEQKVEEIIQNSIEEFAENQDAEIDYEELYDLLYNLYEHPINLNSATREELKQLPFLTDIMIENLLAHRTQNGNFLTLYELKDIPGFYPSLILNLQHFVSVAEVKKKSFKLNNALRYGRHDVFLRYGRIVENKEGYLPISDSALAENPNARYLGSPDQYYFRYTYRYKDQLSWALVGDKDAGEEFFSGSNKSGFDFYTGHLYVGNIGRVESFVVGDYHLSFGQGLALWSGVSFGKSVDNISLRKQAVGIKANTSRNESNFLRGGAATIRLPFHLKLSVFHSDKWLDASLTQADTLDQEEYIFSSINETGYHRTPGEIDKQKAVREQLSGAHLSYSHKGLILGATWYQSTFDKELLKAGEGYQLYDFEGQKNQVASLDFSYYYKALSVYGEAARSSSGGIAYMGGMMVQLHPRFQMSLLYRHYDVDYHSFYNVAVAEGSDARNEEGLYFGTQLFVGDKGRISGYYDLFRFPWLRYRIDKPSTGNELSLQYQHELKRGVVLSLRYKDENKMRNAPSSDEAFLHTPLDLRIRSYRINLNMEVNRQLKLKSRAQWMDYQHQDVKRSQGYLLFQDVQYSFAGTPLKLSLRYALFNTDDYDSRIYAYESDVLYAFSIPAYYGQGQRFYVMGQYKVGKRLSLWLRYSRTYWPHETSIGSGLEEISEKHKSDIRVQVRFKI